MFRQYFWVEGSCVPRPAIRTPRPVSLDVAQHLAVLLLTCLWDVVFESLKDACVLPRGLVICQHFARYTFTVLFAAELGLRFAAGGQVGFHGLKTVWCSSQSLCGRLFTDLFTRGVFTHVWCWTFVSFFGMRLHAFAFLSTFWATLIKILSFSSFDYEQDQIGASSNTIFFGPKAVSWKWNQPGPYNQQSFKKWRFKIEHCEILWKHAATQSHITSHHNVAKQGKHRKHRIDESRDVLHGSQESWSFYTSDFHELMHKRAFWRVEIVSINQHEMPPISSRIRRIQHDMLRRLDVDGPWCGRCSNFNLGDCFSADLHTPGWLGGRLKPFFNWKFVVN